jgi:protein gp37
VPDEYIARVWQVMATSPQHQFLILTKRHARMRSWVNRCQVSPGGWITHNGEDPGSRGLGGTIVGYPYRPERAVYGWRGGSRRVYPASGGWPLPNVWLGISAEDQKWAGIRVPALLATPAAVRFVSAEPLLGPLALNPWLGYSVWPDTTGPRGGIGGQAVTEGPGIDWVIAGGESGPGARPCDLAWLRDLRVQCADARVACFIKQLGAVAGRELGAGPKGGDWDAWPADLRVREYPADREAAA